MRKPCQRSKDPKGGLKQVFRSYGGHQSLVFDSPTTKLAVCKERHRTPQTEHSLTHYGDGAPIPEAIERGSCGQKPRRSNTLCWLTVAPYLLSRGKLPERLQRSNTTPAVCSPHAPISPLSASQFISVSLTHLLIPSIPPSSPPAPSPPASHPTSASAGSGAGAGSAGGAGAGVGSGAGSAAGSSFSSGSSSRRHDPESDGHDLRILQMHPKGLPRYFYCSASLGP